MARGPGTRGSVAAGISDIASLRLTATSSFILHLRELLVPRLQLLDLGLEGVLSIGKFLLALGDLSIEVGVGESHSFLDSLLLLGVAKVQVGWSASWPEVLLCEGKEIVEAAATLVVLEVVRIAVLDGRVALNAVLAAEVLVDGAVDVTNESGLRVLEFVHELVPSRLHGFAVASPRGEELDEDGLASRLSIKVVGGELDGRGCCHEGEEESNTHHDVDMLPC